jgi:hypothetical protein
MPMAPPAAAYPPPAVPLGAAPHQPLPHSAAGQSQRTATRKRTRNDSVELVGRIAAGCVFFGIFPAIALVFLLSLFGIGWRPTAMDRLNQSRMSGSHPATGIEDPPITRRSPPGSAPSDNSTSVADPSNGEPLPFGKPVTIWDGKLNPNAGQLEFSVEYRLDGLSASPESKYFWIVLDRDQAKLEFPIPASVLKPRDHLSGQPQGTTAAQFRAPYQMYLERQAPGMSQREKISNVIRVTGG